MKVLEKIYAGIFVLVIVGVTVLLNSPTVRNGNTSEQFVDQNDSNKYNILELENISKDLAVEEELEDE